MLIDKRKQRGFSLVEVLITIAIITIVLAIGIPSLQGYAINTNLKTAARAVESDFFETKERAIAQNRAYRIRFTLATNSYTIEQCNTTGTAASACPGWGSPESKSVTSFGSDITIFSVSFGGTTVNFQTRGTVELGNLVLRNSRNSSATIRTNQAGRVSVEFTMQ